ncbi:hypothetical protein Btru_028500 [Bulinus truncatus]|nr:hypothetical protein Btru_028500 [Bulinus truncatus]
MVSRPETTDDNDHAVKVTILLSVTGITDADVVVSTYEADDFTEDESGLTDVTEDCVTDDSDDESSCRSDDSIYFTDTFDGDQSLGSYTMDYDSDTLEESDTSDVEDIFKIFQSSPPVLVRKVFDQDVAHIPSHHEDDYLNCWFQHNLTVQC